LRKKGSGAYSESASSYQNKSIQPPAVCPTKKAPETQEPFCMVRERPYQLPATFMRLTRMEPTVLAP
jgi:hypothetical protein